MAPPSAPQDALLSYVAVVMMALEMVGVPLLPEVSACLNLNCQPAHYELL